MATAQPQWSPGVMGGGSAGATSPAAAPKAARIDASATDSDRSRTTASDVALLSNHPLDVKRWINDAVRHELETLPSIGATDGNTGHHEQGDGVYGTGSKEFTTDRDGVAVGRLFSRMQAHAQQVSNSVEELVSQTVVRLPRTAMELQRMTTETNELSSQLQAARDLAAPVAEVRGHSHFQHLNSLRDTQERLRRCSSVLSKALAVDASRARIAQAIAALQKERQKQNTQGADSAEAADSIESSRTTSTATSKTNITELSAAIHTVKRDLHELQAVDPTYGEKHRQALEQHEQVIEKALEHECLIYLVGHDATRAAELLKPLHTIGRADVVLQSYAREVTVNPVKVIRESLGAGGKSGGENNDDGGYGLPTVYNPAHTAEALKERVIPVARASLESELNFLLLLSECMGGDLNTTTHGNSSGTEGAKAVAAAANADGTASPIKTAPPPLAFNSKAPLDVAANRSQLQRAMTYVVDYMGAAFTTAMVPILARVEQNRDLIACYDVTRLVMMSATGPASGTVTTNTTAAAAAALIADSSRDIVSSDAAPLAAASQKTARLGVREMALVQASTLAVGAFVAVFRQEEVLKAFCERAARAVAAVAGVSVPQSASKTEYIRSNCEKSGGQVGGPTTGSVPLVFFLQNAHARMELLETLVDGIKDILHFFPDQTLSPCVKVWSETFSSLFAPLLPARRGGWSVVTGKPPAGGASQAQPLLQLVHLALITKCATPNIATWKRATEALLSSADVQSRYPSAASAALTSLNQVLWAPLQADLDAAARTAQQAVKASVLSTIMATAEAYEALSAWGDDTPQRRQIQAAAAGAAPSAVRTAPPAMYPPGHVVPSEVVREFGEALIGAPLALESLRNELGNAGGVLTRFFFPSGYPEGPSTGSSGAGLSSSLAETVRDGVAELLDDASAAWLEDIVRAAVDSFVEDSVKRVRVDFSAEFATNPSAALESVKAAWKQIVADLEYLRNVLSAVGEEKYDELEECLQSIQALPPPASAAPFVVADVLKDVGQSTV